MVEFGLEVNEMGHHFHIAVSIGSERESCVNREFLPAEIGRDGHDLRLAVVEHLAEIARLFKLVAVNAPFFFEHRPVYFAFVDGVILWLFSLCCLFLRRLLRLSFGCLILLSLFFDIRLRLLRDIDLEVFENFSVCFGILDKVTHSHANTIVTVSRNFEETKHSRVLALSDKI